MEIKFQGKIFKEIPKGQGKYFICKETTEILSMMRPKFPKILKPTVNGKGYLMVGFFTRPNRINVHVHRAMMETFVDNSNNYRDINHIDGNKLNNHLENLEYCTSAYNVQESFRIGLHKRFTNKYVYQFDLKGNLLNKYTSLREAANAIKCNPANICYQLKRKTVHASGFLWDYTNVYSGKIPEKVQKGYYVIKQDKPIYFSSCNEALQYLGISKTCFYSYCDSNKLLNNEISVHTDYY